MLLASGKSEERAIAGIIVEELEALDEARECGKNHPDVQRLHGDDLREVQYLELYKRGQSIRVYYAVIDGCLWMLAINHSKRRTALTEGMRERLVTRLREAKEAAAAAHGSN